MDRLSISRKIYNQERVRKGDMVISIGEQFGKPYVTLTRIENIAKKYPGVKWQVESDGVWYTRTGEKSWEYKEHQNV